MKRTWLGLSIVVGLSLTLALPTWANFQAGRDAFKRGDYEAAVTEWRPLAEQGDAIAQWWLGSMYEKGLGIPQDYEEAIRWFRLAAEQGNELAQNALGNMYCCVKGVTEDLIQAHMWLNLASSQGNSRARSARNMLIKRMTPAQIVKAQTLAREWKPKGE